MAMTSCAKQALSIKPAGKEDANLSAKQFLFSLYLPISDADAIVVHRQINIHRISRSEFSVRFNAAGSVYTFVSVNRRNNEVLMAHENVGPDIWRMFFTVYDIFMLPTYDRRGRLISDQISPFVCLSVCLFHVASLTLYDHNPPTL